MHSNEFMKRAIELAAGNVRDGHGGPFAALVVRDGRIIGCGTNLVTSTNDPTAHAEIVAIREACRALGSFQLTGCDLYTTCEPCPMCMGAIYWARPRRIFYCATRADAARYGFDDAYIYDELKLPLEERRVPAVQVLAGEAERVFREWQARADRVPY